MNLQIIFRFIPLIFRFGFRGLQIPDLITHCAQAGDKLAKDRTKYGMIIVKESSSEPSRIVKREPDWRNAQDVWFKAQNQPMLG